MGYVRQIVPLLATVVLAVVLAASATAQEGARCVPLPPLTAETAGSDRDQEDAFCAIDLDGDSTALCPKTWSTSPAALVYDLAGTSWQGRSVAFEKTICPQGGSAREEASRELAFFKNSLNGRKTSGTFAPASLLYYHFSRLLQTRLHVPVAVPISFPAAAYRERVVAPGLDYSKGSRTQMLHEGWLEVDHALAAPQQYSHERELFIDEGTRLWGVLLLAEGKRYGPEVNGTRVSGWGEGQNRDFQRTAPFIALRTDAALAEAVARGIAEARKDPSIAKAMPDDISHTQVAWWMHEITELVLLDFILGQQDRVGNVDYNWRWVWHDQGKLRSADSDPGNGAQKIRVTALNDNDAGVRSSYANYARSTGMLEGWRHMELGLYRRLQNLAQDFGQSGPVSKALSENYRLSSHEAAGVINRGKEAAEYLRKRCLSGLLRFDLGLAQVLATGDIGNAEVSCE